MIEANMQENNESVERAELCQSDLTIYKCFQNHRTRSNCKILISSVDARIRCGLSCRSEHVKDK